VQVRILKRCEGLLLSRSSWPVLLIYVDTADVAHFRKHGELVVWPWAATIAQRTRLGLHRANYAEAEPQAVRVLVKLLQRRRCWPRSPLAHRLLSGAALQLFDQDDACPRHRFERMALAVIVHESHPTVPICPETERGFWGVRSGRAGHSLLR
jgi:hypothetical protein